LQLFQSHSQEETEALGRELAMWLNPGQMILLQGDLGSGKSTLARAMIRAVAEDETLEVPSPTFSIVQSYDQLRVPIAHIDLYRLKSPADVMELGLEELAQTHALIIEWPALLNQSQYADDRLTINLSGRGAVRNIELDPKGKWIRALERRSDITHFLSQGRFRQHARKFLEGDASHRRYELLSHEQENVLLMDMPARPDGPPVRHGKPYSTIAHLAENIHAVIGINQHLHGLGFSAPAILDCDAEAGLAIVEYLDGELHGTMMLRGDDMSEAMLAAVDVLAAVANIDWPEKVASISGHTHFIPVFDLDALLIETDLMPSWFWKDIHRSEVPGIVQNSFEQVWRQLLPVTFQAKPVWTVRDFHSPNLIWLPQRKGLQRTGLIDTQDAVMGNAAYDVVSLLQDARVDVAVAMQRMLLDRYVEIRHGQGLFDEASFRRDYAILGAQRASRLLGTFTRLSVRDGKHQYLKHRPRVARYLVQNLQHPALSLLLNWYRDNMPEAFGLART
jgi:N-acetylmuramate 1-kinase